MCLQLIDINVFLRAQDYTDYALQTLSCRHLEGLWYEISYRFYEHSEIVRIPLRLDNLSREPRITYVVPLWGGQEYGDSLFQVTPEGSKMMNQTLFFGLFIRCIQTYM